MSAAKRERKQLLEELQLLSKENREFLWRGTFGGWTKEEAAHDEHVERLRVLTNELKTLEEQES